MRLIDADETIKQYTQIFVEKYGVECGEMFQGVLKQMPTAYNVDRVLEQLKTEENLSEEEKRRCACGSTSQWEEAKGYTNGILTAIDIVNGGGLNGLD